MVKWIEGDTNVPAISDDRLADLMGRFTTLVQIGDGTIRRRSPCDPRNIAFTWDRADAAIGDPVTIMREVERFKTDHTCGYHAFFKPSIAEVLAQITPIADAEANAFYIIMNGDGTDDEVEIYTSGGGHRATTVFVTI